MIQDKEPYEYRLTCIEGDHEITHTFSAFVTGKELREYLIDFLRACNWTEEAIEKILGGFNE